MQLLVRRGALVQREGRGGALPVYTERTPEGVKELEAAQLSSCGRKKMVTLSFFLMRRYQIFGGGAFTGNIILLDFNWQFKYYQISRKSQKFRDQTSCRPWGWDRGDGDSHEAEVTSQAAFQKMWWNITYNNQENGHTFDNIPNDGEKAML